MKKTKWIIIGGLCLLALVVGTVLCIVFGSKQKMNMSSVVTVEVNPSISLTLDKTGCVTSCYGNNDEGKMIVQDEEIVGKDYQEAIEIIVSVESDCGYLVKNSNEKEDNQIKITVESNVDEVCEKVLSNLVKTVEDATQKVGIDVSNKITSVKTSNHDALVEKVMEVDSSLSKEKVEKLNNLELISLIESYQIERMTLPTSELVELYNKVKNYQIVLAEEEQEKQIISSVNSIIELNYQTVCAVLDRALESLQVAYYNLFVDSLSTYQVLLKRIQQEKMEVLQAKQDLNQSSDEEKAQKQDIYDQKLAVLNQSELHLKDIETSLKKTLDDLETAVSQAEASVTSFKNSLESSIAKALDDSRTTINDSISSAKTHAFEKFEEKYGDEIEKFANDAKEYKKQLIDSLRQPLEEEKN